MRTVSFLFKEEYKEKVASMLDGFCQESFLREGDGGRQWNYYFEGGGTFYMDCGEYFIAPLGEESYELPIDEYVYLVTDEKGAVYTTVQYPETVEKILAMGRFIIVSADISDRADSTPEVCMMAEEFLSKVPGYAWDDYSERLWSREEIASGALYKGLPFFDFDGWREEYETGGPFAKFGIVDKIDPARDYSFIFEDEFDTVEIQEEAIDCWYPYIAELKTCFLSLSHPATGLARLGVTLIPPESLNSLYDIVDQNTDAAFDNKREFLEMISGAAQANKYIIHIGL